MDERRLLAENSVTAKGTYGRRANFSLYLPVTILDRQMSAFIIFLSIFVETAATSRLQDNVAMNQVNQPARCRWCNLNNRLYVDFHDHEWGVTVHDDRKLFEMLVLESFQAGLSWECVLNKREALREAFDGFDFHKVAAYGDQKQAELMANGKIIRNRLKIAAAVGNAKAFIATQHDFGSFSKYIWQYTGGKTVDECHRTSSPLSDAISADLRRRGMKFVGTTIVYSYLQAIGVINSHEEG